MAHVEHDEDGGMIKVHLNKILSLSQTVHHILMLPSILSTLCNFSDQCEIGNPYILCQQRNKAKNDVSFTRFWSTKGMTSDRLESVKRLKLYNLEWLLTGTHPKRYRQNRETPNIWAQLIEHQHVKSGGRRFKSRSSQFVFVQPKTN